tara:strand:- start:8364 stop:8804 length:441 start_codon:yes stop_codon:yes gene_type:complete
LYCIRKNKEVWTKAGESLEPAWIPRNNANRCVILNCVLKLRDSIFNRRFDFKTHSTADPVSSVLSSDTPTMHKPCTLSIVIPDSPLDPNMMIPPRNIYAVPLKWVYGPRELPRNRMEEKIWSLVIEENRKDTRNRHATMHQQNVYK